MLPDFFNFFNPLDKALASTLQIADSQTPIEVLFAAALTCFNLSKGNVALDLNRLNAEDFVYFSFKNQHQEEQFELFKQHCEKLKHFDFRHQHAVLFVENVNKFNYLQAKPLVYWKHKLYLFRYFFAERQVEQNILKRIENTSKKECNNLILNKLFEEESEQKQACRKAFVENFAMITGGPGTGKTTTVAKLLVLLFAENPHLKIELAAPTGKAAQRLKESIAHSMDSLKKLNIPIDIKEPQTIHRLLGVLPQGFVHHQHHPLNCDVLILDEASMIDLLLFQAVLNALPLAAKLIVLGDENQLSSVDAGSLMKELCQAKKLTNNVAHLKKSHRFQGGIAQFAQAVNLGKSNEIKALFDKNQEDLHIIQTEAEWTKLIENFYEENFVSPIDVHSDALSFEDYALQLFKRNAKLQVLCALREGEFGVHHLNQKIQNIFQQIFLKKINVDRGFFQSSPLHSFFEQCPVMMIENQAQLHLNNGDVGVAIERENGIRLCFGQRWLSPNRLENQIEKMFALTIHKSQGSEFDHVILVLPPKMLPILSRELLYTGATRAKKRLTLYIPQNENSPFVLLKNIINHRLQRQGALFG